VWHDLLMYSTLAVCAGFIGWGVVRYDLYDREPWYALLTAAGLGAVMMYLAGRVQVVLIDLGVEHWHEWLGSWYYSIQAGVIEEAAKVIAAGGVLLLMRRHFNDPLDGIIYGAFAGLGAALEESVWVLGFGSGHGLLPLQEPVRLAGHLVMGGIGGWGLGYFSGRAGRWWWSAPGAYLVAAALHVLWDVAAFESERLRIETGEVPSWTTRLAMAVMLTGMVTFRMLVRRGAVMSKAHFGRA